MFEQTVPNGALIELPLEPNEEEKRFGTLADFRPPVESLGFYFLEKCIVRGRGFVIKDQHLLDCPSLIPSYVRHGIDSGQYLDAEDDATRTKRWIDDTSVVLVSDAHLVFGHWLVDILPRAWLFSTAFGERINNMRVILPIDTPPFATALLKGLFNFGDEDFIHFDPIKEELQLNQAIIPSLLHVDHAFHSCFNLFVSYVLSIATKNLGPVDRLAQSEFVFISRHLFRASTTSFCRSMDNENEVIELVKRYGFSVVCPEDLPFLEQVKLFAGARVVIGESGSGLHNTMFSDTHAVVLCIRPTNQVQATLAALRQQKLMFFCPDDERHEGGNVFFSLDVKRLEKAIKRCIEIASDPIVGNL